MENDKQFLVLTTDIVVAYLENNPVASTEIAKIIQNTYSALRNCDEGADDAKLSPGRPAVAINKSVFDEYIICLEDGQKFKSLKRHLRSKYDMSPEEYRQKWMLPANYPMVAPQYARRRSELAKQIGLGRSRKKK